MNIDYTLIPAGLATPELLHECSDLYSNHYGNWSRQSSISPGGKIKLSVERLREWLKSNEAQIYLARSDNNLIGYAIAITLKVKDRGIISWVTQLVVHESFRKIDVAKTLLFSIWGFTNHYAWGVISANPFAIRALEKATRRRCQPKIIARKKRKLIDIGVANVNYISREMEIDIDANGSKINTLFFVDHCNLEKMIGLATSEEIPWLLGFLEEGWEWFAFTFNDQEQIGLSVEEIEKMIRASDQLTRSAYSRMDLSTDHHWMQHATKEVEFIVEICNLTAGNSIVDFGCGVGRHSIELAKKGLLVTGVDYVDKLIARAGEGNLINAANLKFVLEDCRTIRLDESFDAVICLYDVVGSYADDVQNTQILKNLFNHLKLGGVALISVMNYELTESQAINKFVLREQPDKLLKLTPSQIMEKTGDIFDPTHYLVDTETHVVYRKEQFSSGDSLPLELLVRDRRFTRQEIEEMCQSVGFEVIWSKFVGAGNWGKELDRVDPKAKEILIFCRKPA